MLTGYGPASDWIRTYLWHGAGLTSLPRCGSGGAVGIRFGGSSHRRYLVLSLALPLVWSITLRVSAPTGRLIGTGSDEFRRVLNAGLA